MLQLEVDIAGAIGNLAAINTGLKNDPMVDPLTACVDPLIENFADIFAATKSSAGKVWPPHAPSTVARYGPHPLLILSGYMLETLTSSGAPDHVEEIVNRGLRWGTSVEYSWYNNFGTSRIPAREFMYLTNVCVDKCFAIIEDYVFDDLIPRLIR